MLFSHPKINSGNVFSLNVMDGSLMFIFSYAWDRKEIQVSGITAPGVKPHQNFAVDDFAFVGVETLEETQFLLDLKEKLFKFTPLFIDLRNDMTPDAKNYPFSRIVMRMDEDVLTQTQYFRPRDLAYRVMFFDFLVDEADSSAFFLERNMQGVELSTSDGSAMWWYTSILDAAEGFKAFMKGA